MTLSVMSGPTLSRILLTTLLLISLPLVAMRFTDEVAWGAADFVVAGALLAGAQITYVLVAGRRSPPAYRAAVGIALAAALLLVWANLAVGLIGSEENPANSMYFGVLAVGVVGAAIARLKPRGMARAMLATALAQMLVPAIALLVWKPAITSGVAGVLGVNFAFAMLFAGSAWLFRRSGREAGGTA